MVGGVSLVVPRIVTTSDWGAMDPSSEACDAAGDLRFKASTMPASVASSERRRSLSGGTHRVPSLQLSGTVSGRARRQSGDDVLGGTRVPPHLSTDTTYRIQGVRVFPLQASSPVAPSTQCRLACVSVSANASVVASHNEQGGYAASKSSASFGRVAVRLEGR